MSNWVVHHKPSRRWSEDKNCMIWTEGERYAQRWHIFVYFNLDNLIVFADPTTDPTLSMHSGWFEETLPRNWIFV